MEFLFYDNWVVFDLKKFCLVIDCVWLIFVSLNICILVGVFWYKRNEWVRIGKRFYIYCVLILFNISKYVVFIEFIFLCRVLNL